MTRISIPANIPPWRPVLFDGHSAGFAAAVETMFRVAIEPSCAAIASELEAHPRGDTDASIDRWEDLRVVQLELHRSFALALGGLWERNFQRHLHYSASVILSQPSEIEQALKNGRWDNLLKLFKDTRGFSLANFPMYPQLELLHKISSAVRHGNGRATSELYQAHPELFLEHDVRVSWFSYFTLGGEPAHSIYKLEIKFDDLVAFKDAIVDFWLMIRDLQASAKA